PGSALTIGPAADIYSLGLLLYHLLTLGGFPYPVDGELSAVLHHIARVPAKSLEAPVIVSQRTHCVPLWITALPRVSRVLLEDLNGVLQRTLQKDPAQRYPDASSLTRELESVLSTHFGNRGLTRRHWLIAGSAGAFGFVGAAAWGARHARERRIYEVRSVPVAGAETKSRQTALSLEPMATASVPGPVRALVASTDGQWVACAGMATQDSGFAGLWSVTESQPRWLHTEKLPPLAALVFDEPRGMLLGAGHDGYFYAWQLESGTLQEKLRLYDSSLCMDREAGTGVLVIGSRSGHVQILSTDSYQQRAKLHVCAEHMRSVRFCGGADRIIAGCDAGAIYLIDATSGESLDRVESLGGIVASLSVAPSGKRVVAALYEGWIFSFDAKNLNDMREANVEQQLHSVYAADQWAVAVGTSERVDFFSSDLASRVTLAMGSTTETTAITRCGRDQYFMTGGHDGVLRYFHASDVLAKLSFLGERASA
ncbi:MAG: hypothetical protein KDA79_24385, partial [Planctomycetaceae bacterium]|nr:hypothetical protein [Planctomycetaceae bacterium]